MEGRAEELHERRGEKLGGVGSGGGGGEERVADGGQMGEVRCNQRGQVEGCEDGEGVAEGEEEVAYLGDCGCGGVGAGCGGGGGAEHAGEVAVFVDAEGHVDGGCGEEFGGPGGHACGGLGAQGRGDGVDCVCGEVGG